MQSIFRRTRPFEIGGRNLGGEDQRAIRMLARDGADQGIAVAVTVNKGAIEEIASDAIEWRKTSRLPSSSEPVHEPMPHSPCPTALTAMPVDPKARLFMTFPFHRCRGAFLLVLTSLWPMSAACAA